MKKDKWLVVGSAALVIALGFWIASGIYKNTEKEKVEAATKAEQSIFVRDYSPRQGNADAKVKLVEFFDPECESCRAVYPHIKQIMSEFDGQVELILRYAPFHHNSVFVIQILEAARVQGKYFETLAALFETQPQWGDHHQPRPELIWTYLPSLGLDVDKIREDMKDPKIMEWIEQDRKDLTTLNVRGTPTFFVNGKQLERLNLDLLVEMIRAEIAK